MHRVTSTFLHRDSGQLTPAEKRFALQIEKALAFFDTVAEWADYISFLHKLQKALGGFTSTWVPHETALARALGRCLSPALPSGVHGKTLETYSLIFNIVGRERLNRDIHHWLPGLLPVMSYALIAIKPPLVELFEHHLLPLEPLTLRRLAKPVLMSWLPGLDDEGAESFGAVFRVLEAMKTRIGDDAYFWQCLLLVVLTSADRRPGALQWCVRKLPRFEGSLADASPEARACVSPDVGLLVRAFAAALADNNLFVQRGFFDLLLTHLQLHSPLLLTLCSQSDQQLLVMSACGTIGRKDMSLNRRLWKWLLGGESVGESVGETVGEANPEANPEANAEANPEANAEANPEANAEAIAEPHGEAHAEAHGEAHGEAHAEAHGEAHAETKSEPKSEPNAEATPFGGESTSFGDEPTYFKTHAQHALTNGLLDLLRSTPAAQIEACTMALSLMDKWEIGHRVIRDVFLPCLRCAQASALVLPAASALFDSVAPREIWRLLQPLVDTDLPLLLYILRNFDTDDEEMLTTHLPLVLWRVLLQAEGHAGGPAGDPWGLAVAAELVALIPERAYASIIPGPDSEGMERVVAFYDSQGPVPYTPSELTALIVAAATRVMEVMLKDGSPRVLETATLFCNLLAKVPEGDVRWSSRGLLEVIGALGVAPKLHEPQVPQAPHELPAPPAPPAPEDLTAPPAPQDFTAPQSLPAPQNMPAPLSQISQISAISRISPLPASGMDLSAARALAVAQLFAPLARGCAAAERLRLLKTTLDGLWAMMLEPHGCFEVEAVKGMWSLQMGVDAAYVEAGLAALFLASRHRARALAALWTHTAPLGDTNNILDRSVWLVLDELAAPGTAAYEECRAWIQGMVDAGAAHRFFAVVTAPLLALGSTSDAAAAHYRLSTVGNVLRAVPSAVKALGAELVALTNPAAVELVAHSRRDASTYRALVVHVAVRLLEPGRFGPSVTCAREALFLVQTLLDGTERDLEPILHALLLATEAASATATDAALQALYVEVVTHALQAALARRVVLAAPSEVLVEFVLRGLSAGHSPVVISRWASLVPVCLPFVTAGFCSVVQRLAAGICAKLAEVFGWVAEAAPAAEAARAALTAPAAEAAGAAGTTLVSGLGGSLREAEQCITCLARSLESLLTTAHLRMRERESASAAPSDTGFFGSVLQGVFATESGVLTNDGQCISASIQSAVQISTEIWAWAEERFTGSVVSTSTRPLIGLSGPSDAKNPEIPQDPSYQNVLATQNPSYQTDLATPQNPTDPTTSQTLSSPPTSQQTVAFVAQRLRFRCKKLMDIAYRLEPEETLVALVTYPLLTPAFISKVLCGLDGGNLEATFEAMLSTVKARCDPNTASPAILAPRLAGLLVGYVESLGSDACDELWPAALAFLRETASVGAYRAIDAELLALMATFSRKLSPSSKALLELAEVFVRNVALAMHLSTRGGGGAAPMVPSLSPPAAPAVTAAHPMPTRTARSAPLVSGVLAALPDVAKLLGDTDKTAAFVNSVLAGLVTPLLSTGAPDIVHLAFELGALCPTKAWKLAVAEHFNDAAFFAGEVRQARPLLAAWASLAKDDRLGELVARVQPGGATLFNWSETETTARVFHLRRIAYLLMVSPRDAFANTLSELMTRLDAIFASPARHMQREAFGCLRAVALRFSEANLAPHWPVMVQAVHSVFAAVVAEGAAFAEVDLVLGAAKALDMLLTIAPEEFQLYQWLFITDTADAIYGDPAHEGCGSLIDRLGALDLCEKGEPAADALLDVLVAVSDTALRKPLLAGVTRINHLRNLRPFFEGLSLTFYEAAYRGNSLDLDCCEEDVYADLFI